MDRDEFLAQFRRNPYACPLPLDQTPREWMAAAWEIPSVRRELTSAMARTVRKMGELFYAPEYLALLARSLSVARQVELFVRLRDESGRESEFRDGFERAFPACVAELPPPCRDRWGRAEPNAADVTMNVKPRHP